MSSSEAGASEAPSSTLSSDVFTVEEIRASRTTYGNKVEYLIKWQGYPDSENTWEPEKNIIDQTVIAAFREKQAAIGWVDAREKKEVVTKNLTELVSSMRKGHMTKVEEKMERKHAELRKKKAAEAGAKMRRQLAGVDSDEDDDYGHYPRHVKVEKSSHPKPKPKVPVPSQPTTHFNRPPPVKQAKVCKEAKPHTSVTSKPVEKPKPVVVPEPEKPRTIKDVGIGTFLQPPPPRPPPPIPPTGFDKGYKALEIVGVSTKGKDGPGGLKFLVRWDEVSGEDEPYELVPIDILRVKEPALLIDFFQKRLAIQPAAAHVEESSTDSESSTDDDEGGEENRCPKPPERPRSPAAV